MHQPTHYRHYPIRKGTINCHHFENETLPMHRIKACTLDPLPASIMQKCYSSLVPVFRRVINLSLSSGVLPKELKLDGSQWIEAKPRQDGGHAHPLKVLSLSILSVVVCWWWERGCLSASLESWRHLWWAHFHAPVDHHFIISGTNLELGSISLKNQQQLQFMHLSHWN